METFWLVDDAKQTSVTDLLKMFVIVIFMFQIPSTISSRDSVTASRDFMRTFGGFLFVSVNLRQLICLQHCDWLLALALPTPKSCTARLQTSYYVYFYSWLIISMFPFSAVDDFVKPPSPFLHHF